MQLRPTMKPALLAAAISSIAIHNALAEGGQQSDTEDGLLGVLFLVFIVLALMPTIVAFIRGHSNRWPILLINVVLGGTVIGWFGALIWAFGAVHRSRTGNHGGESGLNIFANDPKIMRIENLPQTRADTPDIGERLLRVNQLRDQGAISQIEYERLRKRLLDGLFMI